MQILRAHGPQSGFHVVELDQILPEAVEVGESRRGAGYHVSSHVHQHWQFLFVIEGTLCLGQPPGPEIFLKRGSLGCIPPNLSHWMRFGPEPRHYVLWVGFRLQPIELRHHEWKLSQALNGVYSADDQIGLEPYFLDVIREATTPAIYQAMGLQLALDSLVLQVVRAITEVKPTPSLVTVHPAVSKALTILETRFRENWTVNQLAKEVGLSPSRLAELFPRESGYPIHKFLTKIRVQHAEALLLHSDLPVGDIAPECGFASICHFSRVFKEVNGASPVKFRQALSHRSPSAV